MTPNDLEAYLQVMVRNNVGSAALKLPDGAELHVSFTPKFPTEKLPPEPTPGGWKGMSSLDDPSALRGDGEYRGELPS